jgi:hypothetical protein
MRIVVSSMRDFEAAISQRIQKNKLCAACVAVPKILKRGIGSTEHRLLREANER